MNTFLHNTSLKRSGLLIGLFLLGLMILLSLSIGQYKTSLASVFQSFIAFDQTNIQHIIVMSTRVSRTLIGLLVGGALATSGALMQSLTRNSLASPSIFGINAGALFFVVMMTVFFKVYSLVTLTIGAFIGAMIAAMMVFVLGSLGKDSLSPIRIVLSGAAISAFFSSFTQGLLVIDEQSLEGVLFWLAGSIAGRSAQDILPLIPIMAIATIISYFLAPSINVLATGDDIAIGLGQNVKLIKTCMAIIVVILAGSSVAMAGSIGFIGLIVPHIVKGLVGYDFKWVLPYCIVIGGGLLLMADIVARVMIIPEEMPIGVLTAIIGVPVFIHIARKAGGQRG